MPQYRAFTLRPRSVTGSFATELEVSDGIHVHMVPSLTSSFLGIRVGSKEDRQCQNSYLPVSLRVERMREEGILYYADEVFLHGINESHINASFNQDDIEDTLFTPEALIYLYGFPTRYQAKYRDAQHLWERKRLFSAKLVDEYRPLPSNSIRRLNYSFPGVLRAKAGETYYVEIYDGGLKKSYPIIYNGFHVKGGKAK